MGMSVAADAPCAEVARDSGGARRIVRLALLIMALGLIRFLPELADWVSRIQLPFRYGTPRPRVWPTIFLKSDPAEAAWHAWPLAVGLMLAWLRWPRLLVGAALTGLVLAIDDLAAIALHRAYGVELPALRWLPGGQSEAVATGVRAVLVALDLAVVVGALRLRAAERSTAVGDPSESSKPPAIAGRMTLVGALVFLALVGYSRLWTFFESVVLHNPQIRRYLAQQKVDHRTFEVWESPEQRRANVALSGIDGALQLSLGGKYLEARRAYIRAINELEAVAQDFPQDHDYYIQGRTLGLNNLAWLLATCPDESLRDPEEAVALARRAVELISTDGNTWNTLAVSHFRAGDYDDASEAFERSMELRQGGDPFDWFFLAMIAKIRGRPDEARDLYRRAAEWREEQRPFDAELHRFHREASEFLGLEPPPPLDMDRAPTSTLQTPVVRQLPLRRRASGIRPADR